MIRLWKDESGFVVSAELILVSSILVVGMIVGLASIRDQIVQEMGDVGAAFAVLNQSYFWDGVTGHTASSAGSFLMDVSDFCDELPDDPLFPESLCITVDAAASPEGPPPP